MLGNPGIYANKKRKKPVLKQKKPADSHEVVKSNPSKRHRDRLNGELDRLMELLPFQEEVRSRLDKLSVLRLCVGFLRVKSYFRATMKNGGRTPLSGNGNRDSVSEAELLLQALSGFLIVVTADGQVFYASPTIKEYLGFHQSDVVHQSVFELIHTDDRSLFREQLHFALDPQPEGGQGPPPLASYSPEQLPPENSSFLERSFVCRFRCLLDNSSGFLALKFQGRLKFLRGQGPSRGPRPPLALFAVATPVQTPSIVEIRAKMLLFQTRHKLDFTPTGVDSRGKIILGYTEAELCSKGSGYQFIHAADMMYCAENHIRMIKTGESGLTYLRLLSKSGSWLWVKSNARLVYRAGRPDFIIVHQRALTSSEGEESLRQRRLQLPFSGATGEAILYEFGPAQLGPAPSELGPAPSELGPAPPDQGPASLLDCLLAQDQSAYSGPAEPPLPVDQVFMDSRALVSFAAVADGNANANGADHGARRALDAMMAGLEEHTENGELEAALQQLEAEDARRLEDAIRRLCMEGGGALEGGGAMEGGGAWRGGAQTDAIRAPCQEGGALGGLESGVQLDSVGLESGVHFERGGLQSGVHFERGGLERGGLQSGVQLDGVQLESGVHFERGGLESGVQLERSSLQSGVHFERGGLESGVQLERGGLESGVHFERGGLQSGVQLESGVHFERGGLRSGVHFERGGLESGVQLERGVLESGVHFESGGLESGAQLDAILSGAVFDYIDSLFQEAPGAGVPPPDLCEPLFQPAANANGGYGRAPPAVACGGGRGQTAPGAMPPLQRLHLRDIFSPSIELPPLAVPGAVPPCRQDAAAMAAAGAPRQATPTGSGGVPGTIRDFGSSRTPAVYQQAPFPAFQGQTFPHGELWAPGAVSPAPSTGPAPCPGPGPAPCPGPGPAPGQSSCMFQQHFPSGPSGGAVQWAGQPGGGGARPGGGAPPPTELHANMQHYLDGSPQSGPAFVAPPLDVAAYLMD